MTKESTPNRDFMDSVYSAAVASETRRKALEEAKVTLTQSYPGAFDEDELNLLAPCLYYEGEIDKTTLNIQKESDREKLNEYHADYVSYRTAMVKLTEDPNTSAAYEKLADLRMAKHRRELEEASLANPYYREVAEDRPDEDEYFGEGDLEG